MSKIIELDAERPHVVSEVICVSCGYRWIAVRPTGTLLKQLKCKNCGPGMVIETGERIATEVQTE